MILQNVLPVLKTKTDVHIIWLVYMPHKLNLTSNHSEYTIVDIHDFKNAVDILKTVKPDIVYGSPTSNLPDIALTLAGRFLNIPVVGEMINTSLIKTDTLGTLKSYITSFFANSVPTDVSDKKQFMKRGRFFIYKYIFLLRTQRAVKMSTPKMIKSCITIARSHLNNMKQLYHSHFSCDLNFLESELLVEPLIQEGFSKSSLVVTGIPQYDPLFKKIKNVQSRVQKDNKIHVLLATHSLFEHGFHTRSQRDSIVKHVVTEICKHKDEMSLVVKIHPSSENLAEYQELIHTIDPSIPIYKDQDAVEFLEEADVIISYSTSSVPMMASVLRKPIIFCNFYNLEEDVMLKYGLVYDCKNFAAIIPTIREALISNPATEEKMERFIRELFYKSDGCASERVSEAILHLLEKTRNSQKIQ